MGDTVCVDGVDYGPGAWLFLRGKPVTFIGFEADGQAWYIRGHVDGGFAPPSELTRRRS
jgi:hypothetical protein